MLHRKVNAVADLALSLSKGGRSLQACFDKLSTALENSAVKTASCAV
jgi:hypothetical protein